VKPYEIVGGNPAKHIKYRFSESQIDSLLKIKWWNWDIEKIKSNFNLILSPNIDEFILKHKEE
jgi:lipopolysaccharide transport system ATP-binding protein